MSLKDSGSPITDWGESLTVQSDLPKTKINNILRQFQNNGGIITHLNNAEAMYKDVSEFSDLADALNQSKEAEKAFMRLPSKVREIFDHDVATWLDTAHDPEKRQALVEAGLIPAPPATRESLPAEELPAEPATAAE